MSAVCLWGTFFHLHFPSCSDFWTFSNRWSSCYFIFGPHSIFLISIHGMNDSWDVQLRSASCTHIFCVVTSSSLPARRVLLLQNHPTPLLRRWGAYRRYVILFRFRCFIIGWLPPSAAEVIRRSLHPETQIPTIIRKVSEARIDGTCYSSGKYTRCQLADLALITSRCGRQSNKGLQCELLIHVSSPAFHGPDQLAVVLLLRFNTVELKNRKFLQIWLTVNAWAHLWSLETSCPQSWPKDIRLLQLRWLHSSYVLRL